MSEQARVKNEGTGRTPHFVYVEKETGGNTALRFNRRRNADRVAAAINRALADEGRAPEGAGGDANGDVHD